MEKKKIIFMSVWYAICAVLIGLLIFGNVYASSWDRALTGYFGTIGGSGGAGSQEEIDANASDITQNIVSEGTVLLKNDGVLPLKSGSSISVLGATSIMWMKGDRIVTDKDSAFLDSLEAEGFSVNPTLKSFYKRTSHSDWGQGNSMGGGTDAGNWHIDEVPFSEFGTNEVSSLKTYNGVAIIVITRGGGEGSDLPLYMGGQNSTDELSYLELNPAERSLFEAAEANFSKIIVMVRSHGMFQMDFLNDYNVNGVLWISSTGDDGAKALGKIFSGDTSPSGHMVDTYCYDNWSTPAMQNFGDYRFVDENDKLTGYSYVNYGESIYSGYRYYETRYEDVMLKRANAGNYDYNSTVAYPFGHGLSYSTFEWSNFNVGEADADGNITATISVKNTGDYNAKDVIQLYVQSPYTDYDIQNGIEKSSVKLVGFAKTKLLSKGETQSDIKITFNKEDFASWDSSTDNHCYINEAGEYYFVAAANAHDAVNQIIAQKDNSLTLTNFDGTQFTADANLIKKVTMTEEKITVSATGKTYQNNFADIKLTDATYLSRNNWSVMDNNGLTYQTGTKNNVSKLTTTDGKTYVHTISAADKTKLEATGWDSAGNPKGANDYTAPKLGQSGTYKFKDMAGLAFSGSDVDEIWADLLGQLTLDELSELYSLGGYGTVKISSIDKPESKEYDGPNTIKNLFTNQTSYIFPVEVTVASTWNVELVADMASCIGDQCVIDNISGWYAPAMNMHRTAFGGRNFEYYSEDAVLSGIMGAASTAAIQEKGVYVYIKHFAMNDQETNRSGNGNVATFATEQTLREVYLKSFQTAVEDGNARGAMTSLNRIGYRVSSGNYALLTSTLREEWGFEGIVITDYMTLDKGVLEAAVAAGLDLNLVTSPNTLLSSSLALPGVQAQLFESAHRIIFVQSNSLLTGVSGYGTPIYVFLLVVVDIVVLGYLALSSYYLMKYRFLAKEKLSTKETIIKMSKVDKILAIVFGAIFVVCLIALIIWFFVAALPALKQAFMM